MRIVYHKKGQWDLFRRKKFVLGRHPKKRWHFIRILCTQLMEHERIKLTAVRAFHLRPTILRILRLARKFLKTEDERYFKKVQGYLTTQLAIEKLFKEIMPRLENQTGLSVNIKKLDKFRKGDNAQMGYIEIVGNEIEEYELAMKEEEQKLSKSPSKKTWQLKILHQELEMFQGKLSTSKEELGN